MKILFFSYGDANDKRSWSNVPYCFSRGLIANGHDVKCFDINRYPRLQGFWDKHILRYLRKFLKRCQYDFFRTYTFRYLINRYIRSVINQNSDADLVIFTTFSFGYDGSKIPVLLFCDWTYESYLQRIGHKPLFFEKRYIAYERNVLNRASKVVSLFPQCADVINKQLGKDIVRWGGVSAVNVLDDNPFISSEILEKSIKSRKILFIGDGKYLDGALLLVDAVLKLKSDFPDIELHIIGLKSEQLGVDINGMPIFCYGYLDKGDREQSDKYYNLLREAAIFCNPTPKWGGFSSTLEAMFYFTAIVISPYEDFVAQFGEKIGFGQYNKEFRSDSLADVLQGILQLPEIDRRKMCLNAHKVVENNTWSSYAEHLVNITLE